MRFPTKFLRQKGGSGNPALGADVAPTTVPPNASTDNILACKIRDINGWPIQRIAVAWTTTAANPVALNGDLYFWEDASAHWYKINDTTLSLKPNQLFFFDVASISDPPAIQATYSGPAGPAGSAGGIEVMLIVTDPGAAVNGTYVIVMGPDLTTVGT